LHLGSKIRVAVLGAASFAEVAHIPGVHAHPGAEVVALFGHDLGRAREMAQRTGVPEATDNLDALLARPDINAVTIVSSDDKHHAYTMAALRARKHVFCEKPMALNAHDAAEMAREAHARGVVHQMSFTFRHNHGLAGLRKRTLAGEIGAIRYIEMHGAWFTRPETREPARSYQNAAYARMGYLGEMGSHYIDAVNFISGETGGFIEHVAANVVTVPRPHESPDLAAVLFRTAGGVHGQLLISRLTPAAASYAVIHGDGVRGHLGYIIVTGETGALSASFSRGNAESLRMLSRGNAESLHTLRSGAQWEALDLGADAYDRTPHSIPIMFSRFIDTILAGRDASGIAATFDDGYRSQAAIDAVLRSAENTTWERVPQAVP
jgi:predicted dehydrogenase